MKLPLASLRVGQQRCVNLGSKVVLVCRTEGGVFAVENRCPHYESALFGGALSGETIRCPMHGAKFDLRTGESLTSKGLGPVKTFAVTIEDDFVVIGE
jgi:nitrite reductase/ring-hydroxylating ferredoxin subunit